MKVHRIITSSTRVVAYADDNDDQSKHLRATDTWTIIKDNEPLPLYTDTLPTGEEGFGVIGLPVKGFISPIFEFVNATNMQQANPSAIMYLAVYRLLRRIGSMLLDGDTQVCQLSGFALFDPNPRNVLFPPIIGAAVNLQQEGEAARYMISQLNMDVNHKWLMRFITPMSWIDELPFFFETKDVIDESLLYGGSLLRAATSYMEYVQKRGASVWVPAGSSSYLRDALIAAAPYRQELVHIENYNGVSEWVSPYKPTKSFTATVNDIVFAQLLVLGLTNAFNEHYGSIQGAQEVVERVLLVTPDEMDRETAYLITLAFKTTLGSGLFVTDNPTLTIKL